MKWVFVRFGVATLSVTSLSLSFADSINSVPNFGAKWFFAIATGAGFSLVNNDMYINNGSGFPSPYNRDIYSSQQSTTGFLNLSGGRRWERHDKWFPAYSLGLFYQHSFLYKVSGTVIQNSLPQFINYIYNWNLSSDILLASAKVNLFAQNRFLPYVTVGLGEAFNHSNYAEAALLGVTPRTSPGFSGNSSQFAYNVGVGLDFHATDNLLINIGYLYQNLGKISGQGQGTWSDNSLALNSYGLNEVVIGFTYLLDN